MAKRSVARIVLSQIGGFIIFLILLAIANYLTRFIPGQLYKEIVYFFNNNLFLLFAMSIFATLSEIFWNFIFPFNLSAPIVSAILSTFIITFVFRFWNFINSYVKIGFKLPINALYVVVFLLALIVGYLVILMKFFGQKKELHEKEKEVGKRETKKGKIGWGEIGNEFKLLFYNIGRSINRLFERDEKKK